MTSPSVLKASCSVPPEDLSGKVRPACPACNYQLKSVSGYLERAISHREELKLCAVNLICRFINNGSILSINRTFS
jgi:hypothetical protein